MEFVVTGGNVNDRSHDPHDTSLNRPLIIAKRKTPDGANEPVAIPFDRALIVFDLDATLLGPAKDANEKYPTLFLQHLKITPDQSPHSALFYDLDKPTQIDKLILSLMVNHTVVKHVDPWDIAMQISAFMLSAEELKNRLNEQLEWAKGILRKEDAPHAAKLKQCKSLKTIVTTNNSLLLNGTGITSDNTTQQQSSVHEVYKKLTNMKVGERKATISDDLFKVYEFIIRAIEIHYSGSSRDRPLVPIGAFNAAIQILSDYGINVAVATNRPIEEARELISKLGLNIPQKLICGRSDKMNLKRKPSPDMLLHLLKQDDDLKTVIIVGDAHTDTLAPKGVNKAGVEAYAVGLYPPRSEETFKYAANSGYPISDLTDGSLPSLMNRPHIENEAIAVFKSANRLVEALLTAIGRREDAAMWRRAYEIHYASTYTAAELSH